MKLFDKLNSGFSKSVNGKPDTTAKALDVNGHSQKFKKANEVFPPERIFPANFNEGLNSIGGKIIITPEQLIFRANSLNLGNRSDRVFDIKDIVGFRKGILTFLYVSFNDGTIIKLSVWKKKEIIQELEARKNQLV